MKICNDHKDENKFPSCDWSDQHAGFVCPKCGRVYSPAVQANNLHYATEKQYLAALEKFKKLQGRQSVSTHEFIKRVFAGGPDAKLHRGLVRPPT